MAIHDGKYVRARFTASPSALSRTVVLALVLAVNTPALASPIRDDKNKGVIRFPNNTTITVVVPDDPGGKGREVDLKAGISAWFDQQALKDRNIKVNIVNAAPPPGTSNVVTVEWVNGTIDGRYGQGGPSYDTNGENKSDGGAIKISRDDEVTNQMAKNLGIHEMGHVLGLDDVTTDGDAMDPDFTKNDTLTITDNDRKEIGAVYAANAGDTQAVVTAFVGAVDSETWSYEYLAQWIAGEPLALFQVDWAGGPFTVTSAPPGWMVEPPFVSGPDVEAIPTYIGVPESFLSFVLIDEVHYLGPDFPALSFAFTTTHAPKIGEYFLNDRSSILAPIPEPAVILLLGPALASTLAVRRRLCKPTAVRRKSVRAPQTIASRADCTAVFTPSCPWCRRCPAPSRVPRGVACV